MQTLPDGSAAVSSSKKCHSFTQLHCSCTATLLEVIQLNMLQLQAGSSSYKRSLQIQTDHGQPLTPTLFTKDVIEGMVSMQGHVVGQEQEPPLEVMTLSETEAVIEFSSRTNIERIAVWMSPLQYWLGQRIQLVCRQAAPEEVEQARRHEEEAERESMPDTKETTHQDDGRHSQIGCEPWWRSSKDTDF